MDGWMDECIGGEINEWMRMDGLMIGGMTGRIDE